MTTEVMQWIAVCGGRGRAATCEVRTSVSPDGAGTISGAGTYPCTTTVVIRATPNPGWRFRHFTEGGRVIAHSSDPYIYLPVHASQGTRLITAVFQREHAVVDPPPAQSPAPVAPRTLSPTGGTYVSRTCQHCGARLWAREGGIAVFSMARCPNCGRNNTFWGRHVFELRMQTVQATTIEVVAQASPASGGTVSGGGIFTTEDTITLFAAARAGHVFDGWFHRGRQVSAAPAYSFRGVAGTFVARFSQAPSAANGWTQAPAPAPAKHTITVTTFTDPSGDGGTATGGGQYETGKTATLVASPRTGYIFYGWFEGVEQVHDGTTFSFVVSGPRALTAAFSRADATEKPAPPPPAGPTGGVNGARPVGMTTGTIIAIAAGGAAVVGALAWFALRKKQ